MIVVSRTVDGVLHVVASFASREAALAYLRRAAEECRASNHRRVQLDESEGVLVTEHGGDDMTVTFISNGEEEVVM
jgi:hypothetical protein